MGGVAARVGTPRKFAPFVGLRFCCSPVTRFKHPKRTRKCGFYKIELQKFLKRGAVALEAVRQMGGRHTNLKVGVAALYHSDEIWAVNSQEKH